LADKRIHIPSDWEKIDIRQLSGISMIVGGPDVGKSTLAMHLYSRLREVFPRLGYLDGDPGQCSLGPPGCMTLAFDGERQGAFPPAGKSWKIFAGSTSPRGHMVQFLSATCRLAQAALQEGAPAIVCDTSGFVSPSGGGTTLKWAKIELLRPKTLIAIQRDEELEPLLAPLRRSRRMRMIVVSPSPKAVRRDAAARRAHRTEKFREYFAGAGPLRVRWTRLAVFPSPSFEPERLVALEDGDGFTAGLGIVQEVESESQGLLLLSPLDSLKNVEALRVGDLLVDPVTFSDRLVPLYR
jgi:polynucleotide 5'-hydroxyl-kinase GRC3/NOL9